MNPLSALTALVIFGMTILFVIVMLLTGSTDHKRNSVIFGIVKSKSSSPWVTPSTDNEWVSSLTVFEELEYCMSVGAVHVGLQDLIDQGRLDSQYRLIDGKTRLWVRLHKSEN